MVGIEVSRWDKILLVRDVTIKHLDIVGSKYSLIDSISGVRDRLLR